MLLSTASSSISFSLFIDERKNIGTVLPCLNSLDQVIKIMILRDVSLIPSNVCIGSTEWQPLDLGTLPRSSPRNAEAHFSGRRELESIFLNQSTSDTRYHLFRKRKQNTSKHDVLKLTCACVSLFSQVLYPIKTFIFGFYRSFVPPTM